MKRRSQEYLHAQDVVVAMKLAVLAEADWTYSSLAEALRLSPSQVHTSVGRLERCSLFSAPRRVVVTRSLLEFLTHGVRYVFPATVGTLGRGVATASSALPLSTLLPSWGERFVWPSSADEEVGQSVTPLIPSVPEVAVADAEFGALMALIDGIRLGKARERAVAIDELSKRLTVS